jgi:putative acetyltransferase
MSTDERASSDLWLPAAARDSGAVITLDRAAREEMVSLAALNRTTRRTCLAYLPELHSAQEDVAYFRDHVWVQCEVWIARFAQRIDPAGFIAFRAGWVDHLYVSPNDQRRGVGSALLRLAQTSNDALSLWTFRRNAVARAFYGAHGFRLVRETDGRDNEEREPDALLVWSGTQDAPSRRGSPRARPAARVQK